MGYIDYNNDPNPFESLIPGRIVHYQWGDSVHAAIVTYVWDGGLVNLIELTETGQIFPRTSVEYDRAMPPSSNTWHWPRLVM